MSNPSRQDLEPDDPEDFLFDSLQTFYDYQPLTFTSAGGTYVHRYKNKCGGTVQTITLRTPDPAAANWALHASSIWMASIQIANHLEFLRIDEHIRQINRGTDATASQRKLKVLELGAAAGLPSILIAKLYPDVLVTATDYPDDKLIQTLERNILDNQVPSNCRPMPYAWGTDPFPLWCDSAQTSHGCQGTVGFDMIIAADTLWNPDLHGAFIDSLQKSLRKSPDARVHLVAGLHTGRYTIESFLKSVKVSGFEIMHVVERLVTRGTVGRKWDVSRAEVEEEKDRRGWVVWIELRWHGTSLGSYIVS